VEVFKGDKCWFVSKKDFSYGIEIVNTNREKYFTVEEFEAFFTKEAAEKWVAENKPRKFTKKQILEAIDYSRVGIISKNIGESSNVLNISFFKNKLGL
jgi:hypothetical protein